MAVRAPRAASTPPAVPPAALRTNHGCQPAAVQRYIAKGTVVYYPDTTSFTNKSKDNFERALAVLGGPPQTVRTARAISYEAFARDVASYTMGPMGSPSGGTNQKKVKRQFIDETAVYYYRSDQAVQSGTGTKYLLLSHDDMTEANTSELPEKETHSILAKAKCVIEILSAWGINVPRTADSSVKAWHEHSRSQRLDYRQDNNYIVLYVQQLGYPLISAKWTKWSSWNPADGQYIVSSSNTGPNVPLGHMIGVTVAGGTKTITDTQGLSPGTGSTPSDFSRFHICYVFRV
jgi:hypothetical protein